MFASNLSAGKKAPKFNGLIGQVITNVLSGVVILVVWGAIFFFMLAAP